MSNHGVRANVRQSPHILLCSYILNILRKEIRGEKVPLNEQVWPHPILDWRERMLIEIRAVVP